MEPHDHDVMTPNGTCHQVVAGQTGVTDPDHGGSHRYHANVHLGATESADNPDSLGDGNAKVQVFKAGEGAPHQLDIGVESSGHRSRRRQRVFRSATVTLMGSGHGST